MTSAEWLASQLATGIGLQNLAVRVNEYPKEYTEGQKAVVLAAEEAQITREARDE